jgi:hypothetical protein
LNRLGVLIDAFFVSPKLPIDNDTLCKPYLPPGVFGTLKVKAKRLVFREIEEEVIELDLNRKGR